MQDFSGSLPQRIREFEIERVLSQRACRTVYLARDTLLDRPVVLKILHEATANELSRAIKELSVAARIEHPLIVPIHQIISDDDRMIIAERYIQGQNLGGYLYSQSPSATQIAELIAAIAEGVAYAHKQGLIHGNLNPGSIIIDSTDRPWITDFGLPLSKDIPCHQRNEVSSSMAYSSPEKVRCGIWTDGRSDIWSLGAILYEMLVLSRPFSGANQAELIEQILQCQPTPPLQIKQDTPAELERICLKCLSKRASARYTGADEFATDLRRWQDSHRAIMESRDCKDIDRQLKQSIFRAGHNARKSKIFISYRREDSAYAAHAIYRQLTEHFGIGAVVFDVDSIPLGLNFVEFIKEQVNQCDALIAVIGNNWLDAVDQNGKRRLTNRNDFVRIEIHTALSRGIPVVPVLVGRVSMPSKRELPRALKGLAERNAAEVRPGRDFQSHLEVLVRGLAQLMQEGGHR